MCKTSDGLVDIGQARKIYILLTHGRSDRSIYSTVNGVLELHTVTQGIKELQSSEAKRQALGKSHEI